MEAISTRLHPNNVNRENRIEMHLISPVAAVRDNGKSYQSKTKRTLSLFTYFWTILLQKWSASWKQLLIQSGFCRDCGSAIPSRIGTFFWALVASGCSFPCRTRRVQNLCSCYLFTMLDYVSAMLCSLLPMYQLCNIPHNIVQSMQNLCWNYV